MVLSGKRALLREVLIFLGVVLLLIGSDKIGQIRLGLPFHPVVSTRNEVSKYDVADKDPSTVLFDTGEIFLFTQPPAENEITEAYASQRKPLSSNAYKVLYPINTFVDLWFVHLNNKYGFFDIEVDRAGACLALFGYPIYWIVRVMIGLHKEVLRGLLGHRR